MDHTSSIIPNCSDAVVRSFKKHMTWELWRVNSLLVVNAMLMGVVVGIGAYAQRYRHHPLIRFLFQGATALFMPIASYVVSAANNTNFTFPVYNPFLDENEAITGICTAADHTVYILQWTMLVQIVAINTTAVVAADARELGRSIAPSALLVVQAIWTCYLIIYTLDQPAADTVVPSPPPLLVMGEDTGDVLKGPEGYSFRCMPSQQQLLRCRFVRYTADELKFIEVQSFLWQGFLKDHSADNGANRVFKVIADELSFIHDYYYSSLPMFYYSKPWLPILIFSISLSTLGYGLFVAVYMANLIRLISGTPSENRTAWYQINCRLLCEIVYVKYDFFGNNMFDAVPIFLLSALVVAVEVRDIACYICSNWTKVALICHYMVRKHDKWQRSPVLRKWVGRVLQWRCKLVNKTWKDNMNLCSVLLQTTHPRKAAPMCSLLRRLIRLPEKTKKVKVPGMVKSAIILKLRSSEGRRLTNGTASPRCLQRDNLLWACSGKGTTDVLLVWHIATSILEVRHPAASSSSEGDSNRIVATHLSGYCAYLVAYCPELLPDDDGWSNDLYKVVKENARIALAGVGRALVSSPEEEYKKLVQLLSADCRHEVVRNGAKLAEQLVVLIQTQEENEGTAWEVLSGFWSEMILFIAPSDNLDGHVEAIARGGELITLLWALLTHVGIISRPDTATAAATDNESASAV
uniref:DUF4220 domain-containing protein n=1 Tax=Leersia perrieri TaxID=77586 RepID=A0A0D9WV88_9ORYZ